MSVSRLLATSLALALAACGHRAAEVPMPAPTTTCPPTDGKAAATTDQIEGRIELALSPFGDRPDVADREASICWLLDHADAAYPIVEARARANPAGAQLELLGRFDRPASTALFGEVLVSDAAGGQLDAALALAQASDPAAAGLLLAAAADPRPRIAAAAIEGLRVRRDAAACPAVRAQLAAADAKLRYAAVYAAGELGCIDAGALKSIARDDADADVRSLAARLARQRR